MEGSREMHWQLRKVDILLHRVERLNHLCTLMSHEARVEFEKSYGRVLDLMKIQSFWELGRFLRLGRTLEESRACHSCRHLVFCQPMPTEARKDYSMLCFHHLWRMEKQEEGATTIHFLHNYSDKEAVARSSRRLDQEARNFGSSDESSWRKEWRI